MKNVKNDLNPLVTPIKEGVKSHMKSVNVSVPAIVSQFDPDTQRAVIDIAVNRITPDGNKPHAAIDDVPVIFSGNDKHVAAFALRSGCEGILLCQQRDIDEFRLSGKQSDPRTKRMFSFSDAVFIPCKISDTAPISGFKNDGIFIAARDFSSYMHLKESGEGEITVTKLTINGDTEINGKTDINGDTNINGATTATSVTSPAIESNGVTLSGHYHTGNLGRPTSSGRG